MQKGGRNVEIVRQNAQIVQKWFSVKNLQPLLSEDTRCQDHVTFINSFALSCKSNTSKSLRYQNYIYDLLIGSSGSCFWLSSNFNFDYLQNIKLLAKVGIPSLQLQVVLLDSIWYLQSSSKESTLLEFKYLFHKIPVERVYHIWGDLIKHNTLNMLFWIWPQPGSNSVFF